MPDRIAVNGAALAVIVVIMLAELRLSGRNERHLLARGATEAVDPGYPTMRWAYPGAFVAMAIEGALTGVHLGVATIAGGAVLLAAKLFKFWAIATLGSRWSYRVFVLEDAPLVSTGPYRWVRHPNYVGVVGELIGMALLAGARVTGPIGVLFFSWLLFRRIRFEERALRIG
jgi:methyltransferase